MESLPFTLDSGITEVSGVVREGSNAVIIEYQTKLLGFIRSGIKSIVIPFEEIQEVSYTSNLFQTKLRIQLKTLRSVGSFPVPKQGELELTIARKHRHLVRSFAYGLDLALFRRDFYDEDEDEMV